MEQIKSFFSKCLSSEMFLIGLGIFSVLPFIIISVFNNPAADDFAFSVECSNHGYWGVQSWWYTHWFGRYFSTALLSLNPLLIQSFFLFKLIPVVLIIALFISLYYLARTLFVNAEKRLCLLFSLCFIFIYLFFMPNVAEGIYWFAGAITYQVANILTILLFSCVIKLVQTKKNRFLFLSVLFAFCVIGSNETSMLVIDLILATIFIYNFIIIKKINYSLLILLVFAGIFSLIVILSPGNFIRGEYYPNSHQIFNSAFQSFFQVLNHMIRWVPFTILVAIIFFDVFNKYIPLGSGSIFNVNPIFVIIVLCLILFAGFFPGYWSMGVSPPARTKNVIYFLYISGYLYLGFIMSFYLKKKERSFITISPWVRYLLFVIIIINLCYKNNIRTAYEDLAKGSAHKNNMELLNRYELIRNATTDTLIVPELKNHATTISAADITPYSDCGRNKYYAEYFGLKLIKTKEE